MVFASSYYNKLDKLHRRYVGKRENRLCMTILHMIIMKQTHISLARCIHVHTQLETIDILYSPTNWNTLGLFSMKANYMLSRLRISASVCGGHQFRRARTDTWYTCGSTTTTCICPCFSSLSVKQHELLFQKLHGLLPCFLQSTLGKKMHLSCRTSLVLLLDEPVPVSFS